MEKILRQGVRVRILHVSILDAWNNRFLGLTKPF